MIIDIYSKNWALAGTIEISNAIVPRVGETIILDQDVGYTQGVNDLLVHDVSYVLKDNTLIPQIKCHVFSNPENRQRLLEENGWLPSSD
jgi:hypothetical protein